MRVIFDIVHPADVHFFKHAVASLRHRDHQVLLTSRTKDVTQPLLERLGLEYVTLTRQGRGTLGLIVELVQRDFGLWQLARSFRPDILIGNNSPCVAHVGVALGKPAIVFDDTEINRHNRLLYRRIASEIHSPAGFQLDLGAKQRRFPGVHAFAYLHPDHFTPDPAVPQCYGLDPREPYFLFRFVGWAAAHDLGVKGLTPQQKEELVQMAARYGRVIISSESDVPAALHKYCQTMKPGDIHHLIAGAAGVVSESATLCSEAACLGRPSILIDRFGRGYTEELELKYRLCRRHHPEDWAAVRGAVAGLCRGDLDIADLRMNHQRLVEDSINVSQYQLAQLFRLAGRTSGMPQTMGEWE